jgi:hypothetical protein
MNYKAGGRQEADRHHDGTDRRAAHAADLGRAAFRATLQADGRRAGQLQGLFEHPGREAGKARRRPAAHRVRADPEDAELPGGAGGGRNRTHGGAQDGVEIGVVTTEGKLGSTAFPLQATPDLLRYYNNYFGVPYPLAKLDQIAIPGGFNGAMENWGGIVYNEATLLYDPEKEPGRHKKLTFEVNAHEVAHQWFGNLVTMAWWDNLWLNEGFASWMASKATEHFHPEWRPYLDGIGRARRRDEPRCAQDHAPDPDPHRQRRAGRRRLRRHHLRQRARASCACSRPMSARTPSARASAPTWPSTSIRTPPPPTCGRRSKRPPASRSSKLASDWTTQPGFPLVSVSRPAKTASAR